MAQPTPYEREFNFSDQQAETPSDPLPAPHVDAEFNRIKLTTDEILENLSLIQNDSGELIGNIDELPDGIVTIDSLSSEVVAFIEAGGTPPDEDPNPAYTGKIITAEHFGGHRLRWYTGSSPMVSANHDFGEKWLRNLNGGWTHREVEGVAKGTFNWTRADEWMAKAAAGGYKVLIVGGNPPAWATGGSVVTIGGNGAYNIKPYDDLQDQADWITAVFERYDALYPGVIAAWQGQNEVNASYWNGTVAQLVDQCENAHDTWAALDPAVLMIGPSVTNWTGARYLELLLEEGLGPFLDRGGVHLYAEVPEAIPQLARSYHGAMTKYGYGDMPIWNTEYSSLEYYTGSTFSAVDMPHKRAVAHIIRLLLMAWISGVEKSFFYAMDGNGEAFMLVDEADYDVLSPAGVTYEYMLDLMIGAQVVNYTARSDGAHIVELLFADESRKIVAWAEDGRSPVIEPAAFGLTQITTIASSGELLDDQGFSGRYGLSIYPIIGDVDTDWANTELPIESRNDRRWTITPNPKMQHRASGTPTFWSASGSATIAELAVSDTFPFGGVDFNPVAQYGQFRCFLNRNMEPGRYVFWIEYQTDAEDYLVVLEGPGGSFYMPEILNTYIPKMPVRGRFEIEFYVPYFYDANWKFALNFNGASGFEHIYIPQEGGMGIDKIGEPPMQDEAYDIRVERINNTNPTDGNFQVNDEFIYTTVALQQSQGCRGKKCTVAGSFGSIVATTANIATASKTVTGISPASALKLGQFIKFDGGSTRQITKINSTTSVELDANAGATATGATVTLVQPTMVRTGYVASNADLLTLPDVTADDIIADSLSIGENGFGNSDINFVRDDGTYAWIVRKNSSDGFEISRRDATGASVDVPLVINGTTGTITILSAVNFTTGATTIAAPVLTLTDTAANIAAVGNAINTTGKVAGKLVWDSTNNRMMRSSGTLAASPWHVIDGSATVTPA